MIKFNIDYFIDTRLLAIQTATKERDLENYYYNIALYRCIKTMRNMNCLFDKPQDETHRLLNELENRLSQ